MNHMTDPHFSDLFWISYDPKFKTIVQRGPNSLEELCIKKLLSDVSLIMCYLPLLPSRIHNILLAAAISESMYNFRIIFCT